MLKSLRKEVCAANRRLPKLGLVRLTWGNVSGIDRGRGLVVIKPSGVAYADLTPENMVIVDLTGEVVEGALVPSSDTPTHLRLYENFTGIGGVAHTHSTFATAFAQAGAAIEAYGTTHADYFRGAVPCARALTDAEISGDYEYETGNIIINAFEDIDPAAVPAVLVKSHGPFTWGESAESAVTNAYVLEEAAKMAFLSRTLAGGIEPVNAVLLDKHYLRRHGKDAYYGQG